MKSKAAPRPPNLPVVLGHQVVGYVEQLGERAAGFARGDRVGVAWIHHACGRCVQCNAGNENLCAEFRATGRDVDGGYAEYTTVPAAFAHPLPSGLSDAEAAPLLCAGAIGYRSLRLAQVGENGRLGLTGFGASGHLVLKLGGRLVINAIRKEDPDQDELLRLRYTEHLWMEREIKTVANVTRRDVREFLELAAQAGLRPEVQQYPLEEANDALLALKRGGQPGAKVLRIH
jgi:D-arabinose 1-dehydrogenase-like Zn-dependent alcohol dehydrogenase